MSLQGIGGTLEGDDPPGHKSGEPSLGYNRLLPTKSCSVSAVGLQKPAQGCCWSSTSLQQLYVFTLLSHTLCLSCNPPTHCSSVVYGSSKPVAATTALLRRSVLA